MLEALKLVALAIISAAAARVAFGFAWRSGRRLWLTLRGSDPDAAGLAIALDGVGLLLSGAAGVLCVYYAFTFAAWVLIDALGRAMASAGL